MPTHTHRTAGRAAGLLLIALGLAIQSAGRHAWAQGEDGAGGVHSARRAEAAAKAARWARWREAQATAAAADSSYDALFYRLELDIDPDVQWLTGRVTMQARIVQPNATSLRLDLDEVMHVNAAAVAGTLVPFTHAGDVLSVSLDRGYSPGEQLAIEVRYAGTPDPTSRCFVFDVRGGAHLIWTLSEPYGARGWWPCKDTPADKADSVDVDVTVPSGLIAVSQGTLVGEDSSGPEKTTFHWRERYPIATYLVSVTAHPYVEQTVSYTPEGGGSPMPVTVWSYPEDAAPALALADASLVILQRFAALFGEYPFLQEKYGYVQFPFGGGMEHQTVTSAGNWSLGLGVHETAHQWFGDAITCRDFGDIWLNEGFATYVEALWDEAEGGPAAYQANLRENRYYGPGTVWVPEAETADLGRIFDLNLSYNKASWILHMLRGELGDDAFFRILRTYAQDSRHAYGTATTEDFRGIAAAESGRNLSRFFAQWVYQPYFPAYLYDYTSTPRAGGWDVHLEIEQLQPHVVYEMPVQVRIQTASGAEDYSVRDSVALQHFDLHVASAPTAVQLDPEGWILHTAEPAIHAASFNGGVLLVNGVAWWSPFWSEAAAAYADSVFAGHYPFTFWDVFPAPPAGYGTELPAPLGHGPIPPETLARFSTVVWVGNAYAGDLEGWNEAAIVSYLRQGGNVLLLARRGQEFLSPARSSYLGLRWAESHVSTLGVATAAQPGLVPMSSLDAQSQCAVFETSFDRAETQLLLTDMSSFAVPRGIAAWRHPVGGGTARPNGGHFAFVSGRPYRWEHTALRTNIQVILSTLFGEMLVPVVATLAAEDETAGIRLEWALGPGMSCRSVQLGRAVEGEAARMLACWREGEREGVWLDGHAEPGRRYVYSLSGDLGRGSVVLASCEAVHRAPTSVARTRLFQVTPNPFNPVVALRFELAQPGRASLRVFDARGRLVATLLDAERPAGGGHCTWDGRDAHGDAAPAGLYWFRLHAAGSTRTVKGALVR